MVEKSATTATPKGPPLTREELTQIQNGCLRSCEYYSQKERSEPLTEKEQLQRQDCLAEYAAIRREIAKLDLEEQKTAKSLKEWQLVEEKHDEDWVVV